MAFEFESQNIEPILSDEIVNILYRSMGEETSTEPNITTNTDAIFRYKYRIMRELLSNKDLLRTLHHPVYSKEVPLNGDKFKGVCVFDHLVLPEFIQDVSNFVCFDIFNGNGGDRSIQITLHIRVICAFDDIKTDHNINRADLLDLIITNQLDWSHIFGGHSMYKTSDTSTFHEKGFVYRDLVYTGVVANNYHAKVEH